MRRLLKWLTILAVVIGGAAIAGRAYLCSDAAAAQVADKLSATFGTRVTVGGLDVGLSGCAATNIAVYESGASASAKPFLTIARADTDLTLSDILNGHTEPRQLSLSDPHIIVRHDREGRLLTGLPKSTGPERPLPAISLTRAGLTIQKEGEPDVSFHGFDANVGEEQGQVKVAGFVNDASWGGKWELLAQMPRAGGPAHLFLKSAGMHITQAMLRRVPYVPDNVWRHCELEGDSPVEVRLMVPPSPDKVRYQVYLTPSNTSIYVPSIDLRAATAAGRVAIDNGLVQLRDVRGKVAEGTLHLSEADLDFRPTTAMRFELDAARMALNALPTKWQLAPGMSGKLSGKATLLVRVTDGISKLTGSGEGKVDGIILSYLLRIQSDEKKGIQFIITPTLLGR